MVTKNPYESPEIAADVSPRPQRQGITGIVISLIGLLLAGIYLANPGFGLVDFIPDNIPGVGNIDEFVASAIFLTCLSRLGINILPHQTPVRTLPKD